MLIFPLLVIAFVLYGSCLHGEMVFDDYDSTMRNTLIASGSVSTIIKQPLRYLQINRILRHWRYFTRISFALNVKLFGPPTFSFHVVNVALHAVNGVWVSLIARELGAGSLATPCALLFVCHSLARDSVAYISSRSVLLSSMFALAAIYVALIGFWPLALPLLFLAFYSKEDTAIVTFAIGAILAIRHDWAASVFFALPIIVAILIQKNLRDLLGHSEQLMATSQASAITDVGYAPIPSRLYCFLAASVWTALLFPLWILGLRQNFDPDIKEPTVVQCFFGGLAATLPIQAFMLAPTNVRIALTVMCISPMVLYWFTPLRDHVAEYRCYLALAGACLLAVYLPLWLLIPLICWHACRTFTRTFDYANSIRFWLGCVRDGSDRKVRVVANLAAMYQSAGQDNTARVWNEKVLAIDPHNGPSMVNRGLLEARAGNLPAARDVLVTVTTRYPRYLLAWQVLTEIHKAMNDMARAKACMVQVNALGGN